MNLLDLGALDLLLHSGSETSLPELAVRVGPGFLIFTYPFLGGAYDIRTNSSDSIVVTFIFRRKCNELGYFISIA